MSIYPTSFLYPIPSLLTNYASQRRMGILLKTYKTEIKPTAEQKVKIAQSMGVCRWLYNEFIAKNRELYQEFKDEKLDKKQAFMSAYDFDKYINNEVKVLPEYSWINTCGSKARKKAIQNAEVAFKRFFQGKSKFPKFKKKSKSNIGLYFPKNSKGDWTVERHRIQIPTLKKVRLKEYGYIPSNLKVISGTVTKRAGRYYVSVVVETNSLAVPSPTQQGLGVDLGITNFAVVSDGSVYKNINKTNFVRQAEKRLRKEQQKLSRKYESLKASNKQKGGVPATRQNIQKQVVRVQKAHQRLANIRTDYINKTINELIKREPSYIVVEDLNVSGMMRNKHLSKSVANQRFHEFRVRLEHKCKLAGVELRVVDRFYPSSKTCNTCGAINSDLKLSDRLFVCSCGYRKDRDLNASYNLRDAKIYKVA